MCLARKFTKPYNGGKTGYKVVLRTKGVSRNLRFSTGFCGANRKTLSFDEPVRTETEECILRPVELYDGNRYTEMDAYFQAFHIFTSYSDAKIYFDYHRRKSYKRDTDIAILKVSFDNIEAHGLVEWDVTRPDGKNLTSYTVVAREMTAIEVLAEWRGRRLQ